MELAGPMTVGSLVPRASADPVRLARDLGAWVLVGPPPQNEENEWSFRTLSARTVRDASGEIEAVLDDTYVIFSLKKVRPGPFASTILVGRSRTNDVCVSHSSVSKLHARIRVADEGLFLSDAGSSNGTTVNGDLLPADQERRLNHGTMVRFGGCSFQVFEPTRFATILQKFSKTGR
jgi:pSer/pThr/pTyr-binding forkhead associated (FHA) protein